MEKMENFYAIIYEKNKHEIVDTVKFSSTNIIGARSNAEFIYKQEYYDIAIYTHQEYKQLVKKLIQLF